MGLNKPGEEPVVRGLRQLLEACDIELTPARDNERAYSQQLVLLHVNPLQSASPAAAPAGGDSPAAALAALTRPGWALYVLSTSCSQGSSQHAQFMLKVWETGCSIGFTGPLVPSLARALYVSTHAWWFVMMKDMMQVHCLLPCARSLHSAPLPQAGAGATHWAHLRQCWIASSAGALSH